MITMSKILILAVFAAVLAVSFAGMMVGGLRNVDVNDSRARDALRFAVNLRNNKNNDMYLHDVKEVVSVQQQLVAGMKYVITANMARTVCRKSNSVETCPINEDEQAAPPYQCTFTVWSKPWENFYKLLEETCSNNNGVESPQI